MDRGFVTYSNEAKRDLLGVPDELLMCVGAVSEEVARAMAAGALACSDAALAVAVTGIAGPGGGTAPPSRSAWCTTPAPGQVERSFTGAWSIEGDRGAVRLATVATALDMLIDGAERRS